MIKKLISILFILLLLTSCGGSKSINVTKLNDSKILENLDDESIDSISVYDENYEVFNFFFAGSDDYNSAMDLIKKLEVIKENVTFEGEAIYTDIYTTDSYVSLVLYDNGMLIENGDGQRFTYKSLNCKDVKEELVVLANSASSEFSVDGELLFEQDGFSVYSLGPSIDYDGNKCVDIEFVNNSSSAYEVVLNSIIDGIYTRGITSYICFPSDAIGYTIDTLETIYKAFSNSENPSISYYFDVYEYDSENYETLGYLYTSDVFDLIDGEKGTIDVSSPVYEDEIVKVYNDLKEDEMYTLSSFYIENKLNLPISVTLDHIVSNGEDVDLSHIFNIQNIKIDSQASVLTYIPVYTFDFNSETGETVYFNLDSLDVCLNVVVGDAVKIINFSLK